MEFQNTNWRKQFDEESPLAFQGREWALAFIERTLQSQREEMVKFIKSGRIALANIGTTERPEYIFHIPEKVFDDALIKDTPQLKAKE